MVSIVLITVTCVFSFFIVGLIALAIIGFIRGYRNPYEKD